MASTKPHKSISEIECHLVVLWLCFSAVLLQLEAIWPGMVSRSLISQLPAQQVRAQGGLLGPPAAWFYLSFPLGLTSLQSTTQSCWSQVLVLWYPESQELREKLLQGPSFALHEKLPIKLNPEYAQVGSYRIQALVPALCILRGQLPTELAKGKHQVCRSTKL